MMFQNLTRGEYPELLLHIAANGPRREVLEWLLQQHCTDIDGIDDDDGLTPLHVAAMYGRSEMIRILLQYGANPNILDKDGSTPCDHAHTNEFATCVKIFKDEMSKEEVRLHEDDELDRSRAVQYVSMVSEECLKATSDEEVLSKELQNLRIEDIRQKLVNLGEKPGPITIENRPLYLKYLSKVMSGKITVEDTDEKEGECHFL